MKKLSLLLILAVTLFSCKVTWIATKSPTMIATVIDIQNNVQSLFDGIALGDKGYEAHAIEYAAIRDKINTIVRANEERSHAANILRQSVLLQRKFIAYGKEHEAAGTITAGDAKTYKIYIESLITPLLKSELSLK